MAAESTTREPSEAQKLQIIAELAEHISQERFAGERVAPEELAEAEGISIQYADFPEDFDGILLFENNRFVIVCNERRAPRGTPRNRFTLAHELGHYFIDDHRRALVSGKMQLHFSVSGFESSQPIEKQADHFAANLLMPGSSFVRKYNDQATGLSTITWLSSVFGTSVTSSVYRALQLDCLPAPAAVFHWNTDGSIGGRKISPTTATMFSGYRSMADRPPKGSCISKAFEKGDTGASKCTSDCTQWFPLIKPGERRNVLLIEETMGLGRFGWITVVYRQT